MICDSKCDLSWRMFHEHFIRKCILLFLDGMSYKYQLSPSGLVCHLKLVFPCLFSVWMVCPLVKVGCQSPLLWLCYCRFPLLWLLAYALCIEVLLCSVHRYLQLLYLLLGLISWYYVVSFLVSCNSLYFKVYFLWYEYCYSNFLLISICMECLFPCPHFHSVCVPRSEVGLLKTAYIRVLFMYPFSQSVSFGWGI